MATCSGILAWRIPWTEEPDVLQPIGSQRAGHAWSNLASTLQEECNNLAFICLPIIVIHIYLPIMLYIYTYIYLCYYAVLSQLIYNSRTIWLKYQTEPHRWQNAWVLERTGRLQRDQLILDDHAFSHQSFRKVTVQGGVWEMKRRRHGFWGESFSVSLESKHTAYG